VVVGYLYLIRGGKRKTSTTKSAQTFRNKLSYTVIHTSSTNLRQGKSAEVKKNYWRIQPEARQSFRY
jgi:hypothetical protein